MNDQPTPQTPEQPPARAATDAAAKDKNIGQGKARGRFPSRNPPPSPAASAPPNTPTEPATGRAETTGTSPARARRPSKPRPGKPNAKHRTPLTVDELRQLPVGGPTGRTRALRRALGWQQGEFADAVGVSRETVSHWENLGADGRPRQRPSADNGDALAQVARDQLGLDVQGQLFHPEQQTPPAGLAQLIETVVAPLASDLAEIAARFTHLSETLNQAQPEPPTQQPAAPEEQLLARPVSARIKHARLAANLTQQQLADHVGTDRIQVVHWEAGRSRPVLRFRRRIAQTTGFPLPFFNHDGRDGIA